MSESPDSDRIYTGAIIAADTKWNKWRLANQTASGLERESARWMFLKPALIAAIAAAREEGRREGYERGWDDASEWLRRRVIPR